LWRDDTAFGSGPWVEQSPDKAARPLFKGVFVEGHPIYDGSGFYEKTHVQVVVQNPECIKGVFRVPQAQLRPVNRG